MAFVQKSIAVDSCFFPQSEIEEQINQRGGREGYVYKEGFSLEGIFDCLKQFVSIDAPGWEPRISNPYLQNIRELTISQPGIDLWRMLCFAFDHSERPELFLRDAPDCLVLRVPTRGQVLYAGNHRALFAVINGISVLKAVNVPIPREAGMFINSLENNGIGSLVESFIEQVEGEV